MSTERGAVHQRGANRLHKLLEDAGIKLSCVATDVLGVSGRPMLQALISGTRDPEVLAGLARGWLRAKLPALRQALVGNFKPHHALILSHILAHLDYLDEAIGALTEEVDRRLVTFAHKAENLATITGVAERVSQVILAELGPVMSRCLSAARGQLDGALTGQQGVRWQAPLGQDPQGQPASARRADRGGQRGDPPKNTYLRTQYEQIKRRRGHKKAIVAVAHSILIAAYHILNDDVPYHDLGGDYFARRADPERIAKRLVAQLERLGHIVTLQTSTADGWSQRERDFLTKF